MLYLALASSILFVVLALLPASDGPPRRSSRRQIDLDHAHGPDSLF